jgi:signal transduction histidine kinase
LIQQHARQQIQKLPETCRRLRQPEAYVISISQRLEKLFLDIRGRIKPKTHAPTKQSAA